MSVYRPKGRNGAAKTAFYHYDFQLKPPGASKAVRFYGSTGQTKASAARRVEDRLRELAATGKLSSHMTVSQACWRYYEEVGKHRATADDTAKNLEYVNRLLGGETLLVDVTADKIASAASRRAAEPITILKRVNGELKRVPIQKAVTLSTVNRQVIEPIRRLLRRARRVWKVPVDLEAIDWSALRYQEPAERVREMSPEEADRFWQTLRADYHPICRFYLLSGRRRGEVVDLTKFDVDLGASTARFKIRKKRRVESVTKRLTASQAQILREQMAKSTIEAVFTYERQHGEKKGERFRITASGLKMQVQRALKRAGVRDFHLHDFRHTFGTALLRASGGNFELVRKALDHSDIKSTRRYAHVLDQDVVEGVELLANSRRYPGAPFSTVLPSEKKRS